MAISQCTQSLQEEILSVRFLVLKEAVPRKFIVYDVTRVLLNKKSNCSDMTNRDLMTVVYRDFQ
jgi:hypothetical protein